MFLPLVLGTQYALNLGTPYITIVIYAQGGPGTYLLEYGRIDERDYASGNIIRVAIGMIVIIGSLVFNL